MVQRVPMESCEVCGFAWGAVDVGDIPARLTTALDGYLAVLSSAGATPPRPSPEVWSAMEYCGHVRDVMLLLRERIILALALDNPVPAPMHQEVRLDHGLYAADTAESMADELWAGVGLLTKTITALDDATLDRTLVYAWPRTADRDLRWVAAQALHEAEHHLADVRAQLR